MEKLMFYTGSMYRGGAQRVFSVILNSLAGKYDIDLVTDISPDGEREEYPLDSRIRRTFLFQSGEKKNNVSRILLLRKLMKAERPKAVVSFLGPPNIRNIIASFGLKHKTIVSVRNDPYKEYGGGVKKKIANLLFRGIDMCVFQTEEARSYFYALPDRKARIIPNPIDDSFYEEVWVHDKKEIAVVGRLEKQKNPFMILEAFSKIRAQFPDHTLHYYGGGSLLDELKNRIGQLGLESSVFVHGEVNRIASVLSHACMFVLCSDFEGMPNALMEAMAVGVVCISTDCPCGGPRFLLGPIDSDLLVPCKNADALAKRMSELLSDPGACGEISKKIKERAESFRTNTIVREWEKLITTE